VNVFIIGGKTAYNHFVATGAIKKLPFDNYINNNNFYLYLVAVNVTITAIRYL